MNVTTYELLTAKYGNVCGERDSLSVWKEQLTSVAYENGWTIPQLTQRSDGIYYNQEAEPVLQLANDYPELTADQLNAIAQHMNDTIRESIHAEIAPCRPGQFLAAYMEHDPSFPLDQFKTE